MMRGSESEFEEATVERLVRLGYSRAYGPDLGRDYADATLGERLRSFLVARYPEEAAQHALRVFLRPEGVTPALRNMNFVQAISRGVEAKYKDAAGTERVAHVYPIDWDDPESNDFLAVNQFTVTGKNNRRPDVVVFVNGLPLVVFELKNPYDENPTVKGAHNQFGHYLEDIPQLFEYNAFCVVSDGVESLHGVPNAGLEWWAAWKSINGRDIEPGKTGSMKTLIEGLFPKARLLEYIRHFLLFENVNERITKKAAKYHQFFVVRHAVERAAEAFRPGGDPRIGVVWHTQGSGKSLEMVFLVGILRRTLGNPTFVIQVDRNVLDNQLYQQFVAARYLVGEVKRADDIDGLRQLLSTEAGQIIFTTLQKFSLKEDESLHPVLSARDNVIVIADEAHRSQYGLTYGLAHNLRRALPNARFMGFTGTPIDFDDADTRAVFGEYVEPIYDMPQSQEDGSTVPVNYEPRLVKLHISNPDVDQDLEEIIEETDLPDVERRKAQWAALEQAAGATDRVRQIAADIVTHFEKCNETLTGKAMVVCMSRRNCVALFDEIVALRPAWNDPALQKGALKIVMTSRPDVDPVDWNRAGHVTTSPQRELLAQRFKDEDDPLKMVIVCDMWLTGFDVQVLHTMYVDKPMRGHNLMQAIAQVNRVFKDKPGGLVVDYIGIGEQLKEAAGKYRKSGGRGNPAPPIDDVALTVFFERLEAVRRLMPEDCSHVGELSRIELEDKHCAMLDHLLETNERRDEYLDEEHKLTSAASLVMHLPQAQQLAPEVAFYQRLRASIRKTLPVKQREGDVEQAVRDLVGRSLGSEEVVDLYAAAGLEKPDISIVDERFLQEFAQKQYPNLRLRLLEKLLKDNIQLIARENVAKSRKFSELLEKTLDQYHNNLLTAAQLVAEMIKMRKEMDADAERRKALGLSDEELAFYDSLVLTGGKLYDQPFLAELVREIVPAMKRKLKPDWTKAHREDVQAAVRLAVKDVLRARGVKSSDFELIIARVMEQASEVYADWPVAG